MRKWLALAAAITAEAAATMALKAAVQNPSFYGLVAGGYLAALGLFGVCLRLEVNVGVAYGIRWGAVTILTVVLATGIYDEPFSITIGLGTALTVIGVLTVQLGSRRHAVFQRADHAKWVILTSAVLTELSPVNDRQRPGRIARGLWTLPIAVGYLLSGIAISQAVRLGLALGIAYGMWACAAAAVTAVNATVRFRQPANRTLTLGMLILAAALTTAALSADALT